MGKASKWLMNFLLGRKEDKNRKKDNAFLEEAEKISTGIFPSTPIIKRRWSFGRSSSKGKSHKSSKSLDLNTTNPVDQTHEIVNLESRPSNINTLAFVKATTAPVETSLAPKPATDGIISKELAAATKIQAMFRSYLARKALCALRGLVKLQALVRGHLVRKQTTATLRCMHALMTIQVRARFQRIQMAAEESQLVAKTQPSRCRNIPRETQFRRAHGEAIDTNLYEAHGVSKSKSVYLNSSKRGRIDHGVTKYFSRELSISKRRHYQYEEFSFSSAQNTPQHYHEVSNIIPGRASFSWQQQPDYSPPEYHDYSFQPNYMANTESSTAKARSQSEPKRRPEQSMRTESKQMASIDGTRHSSPRSKQAIDGNQESWFIKLYKTKKLLKESESDTSNTTASHSNHCNSAPYEPYVTLY